MWSWALYIVYRQVCKVPWILRFEPSLDALSLQSDVISSIKILSLGRLCEKGPLEGGATVEEMHVGFGRLQVEALRIQVHRHGKRFREGSYLRLIDVCIPQL